MSSKATPNDYKLFLAKEFIIGGPQIRANVLLSNVPNAYSVISFVTNPEKPLHYYGG